MQQQFLTDWTRDKSYVAKIRQITINLSIPFVFKTWEVSERYYVNSHWNLVVSIQSLLSVVSRRTVNNCCFCYSLLEIYLLHSLWQIKSTYRQKKYDSIHHWYIHIAYMICWWPIKSTIDRCYRFQRFRHPVHVTHGGVLITSITCLSLSFLVTLWLLGHN